MADPLDYMSDIVAIAYTIGRDKEVYHDIKSEMCLAILELDDVRNRSFVLRAAKHRAIDFLRSRKHSHSAGGRYPHFLCDDFDELDAPNLIDLRFEERIATRLDANGILSTMSEEDREVVRLWMDGYDQQEIATVVGVARSTISKRLKRIFQRVRKNID